VKNAGRLSDIAPGMTNSRVTRPAPGRDGHPQPATGDVNCAGSFARPARRAAIATRQQRRPPRRAAFRTSMGLWIGPRGAD
jgi:hypothetical protein